MALSCESLVEDHLDALHGLARAWTGDAELAKELVQRSFLKAFEKRHQLRDPRAARAWLVAILRHEIAGEHRVRARFDVWEPDAFESLSAEEKEEESLDPDLKDLLPAALNQLPDTARRMLHLRFQQELSYEEIAELMQVPVGTVMSRLHRAKANLKALLSPRRVEGGSR
jgi:RNA polymerase sigma-70 factor, ECF subfamily